MKYIRIIVRKRNIEKKRKDKMLERQHRNLARYDSSIQIEGIMVEEKIYPRKENDNDEEILWNRK